ncbi:putative arginyl tRNA synthetase [Streptomyces ambofaciens ATCC 23877]|uniref:arginine--tRNA ligase n=1 Tax=Streptomyces ambofaciens (strain ATCC 23877 / 3486 / DSM 40053 / JCM 4204 / NBRC 12836 / NRRL B-2516) TaxID=278992 RepID=A0A0K2AZ09_STRA7|nr:DALR anticodon-binding domain-containing protein [Streptomyces ambofaciens]AKZ58141.1 putative arginyl tRNA synthetase [Streptomyces ambofaciens ATCC 23877]
MTPVELSRTVLHAVRRAVDAGELHVSVPPRAVVTPPGPGGCGDYATNIALQLARPAGQPPLRVAEVLRPYLVDDDGIADVVLSGPGFLNISLHGAAPAGLVEEILRRRSRYGHADGPDGRLVELHCPRDLRAVVVAEAAGRVLRSQGALVRVTAEALDPEWTAALGVRVAVGPAPAEPPVNVRPVPAPADPLPLGRDAARWALLHPAAHDRPRIGDEHLVQRESNPLFRVRYAHARCRAAARNAAGLGFTAAPGPVAGARELLVVLADHPRVLAATAAHRAPDRLARHLVTVADAALPFLPTVLPVGEEKPSAAHRARLALAQAVGAVLAGGLSLLGIDAPDHL